MATIDTTPLQVIDDESRVTGMGTLGIVTLSVIGVFLFFGLVIWMSLIGLRSEVPYVVIFAVMGIMVWIFFQMNKKKRNAIAEFAVRNGITPVLRQDAEALLPPSLRDQGTYRVLSNSYQLNFDGKPVDIFDYSYQEISRTRGSYLYGVAIIQTEKSYPHIYLDGKANGGNGVYKSWQKLSLEGDFNKYFDLYAEKDMQIETLSFLTPDVMAQFIDNAQNYDIEAYGNTVAIIAKGTLYNKKEMDGLLRCLDALMLELTVARTISAPALATSTNALQRRKISPYLLGGLLLFAVLFILSILDKA